MNSGSGFSFVSDPPILLSPSESPSSSSSSSSFTNKRSFDNAFDPSTSTSFHSAPRTSSFQPGWTNNRGGYSNNYRGGSSGYNRFPKRSRPYHYQN